MPNDPDLNLNWDQPFWARSPIGLIFLLECLRNKPTSLPANIMPLTLAKRLGSPLESIIFTSRPTVPLK